MKYTFIVMIAIALAGSWYWWQTPVQTVPVESTTVPIVAGATQATSTTKTGESNIYRNERWGISFEYPLDWEIKEPAFGSKVSLFNLSIDPKVDQKYPETILINITPKYWIDRVINSTPKEEFTNIKVDGREAFSYASEDMSIPTQSSLVLIENSYWIDISGKTGYEVELAQVLESLTITPVEIEKSN